MKSTIKVKAIFSLILITCALLFITCENPDVEEEGGMGEFTINLSAGISRAAYPPSDVTGGDPSGPMLKDLRLEVTFTETEGASPKTFTYTYTGDKKITGTIAEGRYTVTMKAYLIAGNSIYALGSAINSAVGIAKGSSNATIDVQLYDASLATVWVSKDGGALEPYPNLKVALDFNTTPGNYTVTLDGGVAHYLTPTLLYGTDNNITLKSKEPLTPAVVQLSSNGYLFAVFNGVSLTLDSGITLRGRNITDNGEDNTASVIWIYGGKLIMQAGSKIIGNTAQNSGGVLMNDGTFTMSGGEISGNIAGDYSGGGVNVFGGTFTMTGGNIIENKAGVGAVYVYYGTFNMSGGNITENATNFGGGVNAGIGEFNMSGGAKIYRNTASWNGGGVHVGKAEFTMTGGEIYENIADGSGGGVTVTNNGTFTMSDGEISGNEAGRGSGVSVSNGTFKMSGGEISGNEAYYDGGGVLMYDGTFTMSGGEISGNTAGTVTGSGGGVLIYDGTTFTMSGGKISANTAMDDGGGVSIISGVDDNFEVINPASFTMQGGEISGNDANCGGGVCLNIGIFIMNGGEISGNSAAVWGGGVGMWNGGIFGLKEPFFTMNGGVIQRNSAGSQAGGVFVNLDGTFIKSATGGIIRGFSGDPTNGNVVGTLTAPISTMGHAVWTDGSTLYRDNTVTATEALGWDGATGTSSGTW